MTDVYEQALNIIVKFSSLYNNLAESDRCVYDDLVVLENCDLQTSGFETEEEKIEYMACCVKHFQNKTELCLSLGIKNKRQKTSDKNKQQEENTGDLRRI